jgi:hypothetical protein
MIGTQCYALQRRNAELTAGRRANLSTALLRSTSRSRAGSGPSTTIANMQDYAHTR